MESFLGTAATAKAEKADLEKQMNDLKAHYADREKDWAQQLEKAKMDAATRSMSKLPRTSSGPFEINPSFSIVSTAYAATPSV